MQSENKIDRLEDYINEYCNYGCAYFVLRRVRSQDEAYTSERVFEDKPRQPKFENHDVEIIAIKIEALKKSKRKMRKII